MAMQRFERRRALLNHPDRENTPIKRRVRIGRS